MTKFDMYVINNIIDIKAPRCFNDIETVSCFNGIFVHGNQLFKALISKITDNKKAICLKINVSFSLRII